MLRRTERLLVLYESRGLRGSWSFPKEVHLSLRALQLALGQLQKR